MTDSSATPRNNGEPPLHEDDPLMELSRILDFGVSAEDNAARRSDPEFGSAHDALSFDAALELERELLGDFADFSERGQENQPELASASASADFSPSSSTSFEDISFASEETSFAENEFASALEHELDLHMEELDLNADAGQFTDPLASNQPLNFDQNEIFETEQQPEVFSQNPFDSEPGSAIGSPNFTPDLSFEDDYSSEFSTEWDHARPEDAHSAYLNEPHQAQSDTVQSAPALSLEEELQNLLFGDEPIAPETPSFEEVQPDLSSELGGSAEPPLAEQFFSEHREWAEPHDILNKNDAFTFEPESEVTATENAETAEIQSAPDAHQDDFAASRSTLASDAPVYPHYPRGNFSPNSPVTGLLAPEPPHIDSHSDGNIDSAEDDLSFGEEFALDLDLALQRSSADQPDQDHEMAGFDEFNLNVDDFGFEASGDNSDSGAEPVEEQLLFDSGDLLSFDDLDLSEEEGTDIPQNVEQYAHATYSDNAESPDLVFSSSFDKQAPEIETISVGETKVEQTHALDLPEIPYEEEDKNTGLSDLEAEFAEVFNTIDIEEPQPHTDSPSEADRAFEDIFRENATSYLAAGAVAGAAMGASAASSGLARGAAPADTQAASANNATNDDFYNHWAATGAQTTPVSELREHPSQIEQGEEDLGSAAEAYRNRPVRGRRGLIVASIAGAAVLVGGIGYHLLAGGGSGEPVIVRASDQPVKVQPENPGGVTVPNQDKAVYDRVAGTLPGSPEQKSLIASGEEPVDLAASQDFSPTVDDVDEPIASSQSNSEAEAPLIRPREVETMIVRPDGSIMRPQLHTTAAADQAPPAEPDASVSSDAPLISPPAETDQIADLAAGNDIPAANIPAANDEAPALAADAETTAPTDTAVQPQLPIRPPLVPSRPAQQPTNVVGNVAQRTQQTAQAPAETQVASAAGVGGYFVQIASQPTPELAQKSYANMAQRYGNVIGGRAIDIKRAEIPNKGTYYRVRVQAGTRNEATALCERLKSAGGSCFVTQ